MKRRRVRFDIRRQGMPVLIGLLTLIAVNLLVWVVLVRPNAAEYRDRAGGGGNEERKKLLEDRASVENAEAYVNALGKAAEDWRYLRSEILATRDERLVEVMQELTRLCAEFRIDINTVQIKNETLRDEGLDRFAMVVPLQGGYASLRQFLQAVEASEKFMVVERVALDGVTHGAAARHLQLNITVASYFSLTPPDRPES